MPKVSPMQMSFNAGELSPQLDGRIDIEKYKKGCRILENFIPKIHGPASKRTGTRHVAEVKDSSKTVKLVSFEFNVEQAYILEFGDLYMRVYKNGGQVLSGGVYEIATPYAHTELSDLHFAQSADVMYLAHPLHAPQKLGRLDHDDWSIDPVDFDWVAFNEENTEDTTITASAVTGAITLTSSVALFTADHVGAHFKLIEVIESKANKWEAAKSVTSGDFRVYEGNLYKATSTGTTSIRPPIHDEGVESDGTVTWEFQHDGSGYAEVTSFTSTTVVNATVIKQLPDSSLSPTKKWAEGAWSDHQGYPKAVAFYEDRLWYAGTSLKPQTLWASVSGDYENQKSGTKDDDALNYTINSQEVNVIEWLAPGKLLIIGTSGGEFIASGSSPDAAITPTSVRITRQTTYGSASTRPYRIGNVVLFIQRSGQKIREFVYQFDSDSYVAPDMTILANHVLEGGAVDLAYQQEPSQILWMPRADGQLIGLTYERAEEVVAWHRHILGGEGLVESAATIPHWDGDQDSTWLVVKRNINGVDVRHIEYFEKELTGLDAFYVDAGLSYSGSPITVVSGLGHLEGETVRVLADGAVHPDLVVSSGSVTLQLAASDIHIGLGYDATIKTMRIEAGAAEGVAQGKEKRITNITIRMSNTGSGLFYGPDVSDLLEVSFRDTNDLMDTAVPLMTGDTDLLPWGNGYDSDAYVTIQHRSALPCTIVSLMMQVHTYDR